MDTILLHLGPYRLEHFTIRVIFHVVCLVVIPADPREW